MAEEGIIKFSCEWDKRKIKIPVLAYNSLTVWRNKLFALNLLGMYDNGIGFGNISFRNTNNGFFISGSATGGKPYLEEDDYALVTGWQYNENQIQCIGLIKASSESLTHAAVYETQKDINAVIHFHSNSLWRHFLNKLPTTSSKIEFGTPEMAEEVKRLLEDDKILKQGIIIMGGHKEGIITFGKTMDEAGNCLLDFYFQFLNNSTISKSEFR